MEPGICYIKKEYLLEDEPKINTSEAVDKNDNKRKSDEGENDDSEKYQKSNKKERKRGQNKHRPVYKEDRTLHLCHSLVQGPSLEACNYPNCRYVHDLEQYLLDKGDDLGDECVVFKDKGYCPRGVTCRFAKTHLDSMGRNIKAEHYNAEEASRSTCNGITNDLQIRLRKYQYDFSKTKTIIKQLEKERDEKKQQALDHDAEDTPLGPIVMDEKKAPAVDFRNKLILSPLTTLGNLPFRRICKEFGADITCGEMACVVPLIKGLSQEWALTKRHVTEDIFGVQLCGNNPNTIVQAAQLLQETAQVNFIDLNIGCPIDLIYKQGGGSALMRRTNILELTVRGCAALSSNAIPVTVKMRTGIYADKSVAHTLMPLVEEWGAAAVTLHGRSREQRYTKSANWEYIEECASKVINMPVIGNGDILTYDDYCEKRKISPHVSSVMIGRGALIKPWIFKEIKEQKSWDPSSTDRFEILKKYINYGLEHWGSDTKGIENTRRFFLEWQSFLYRYIPYELLANPPQGMNQRPQNFRGRDELETLMASPNSADWVKLSEMLLGPVPVGFQFVPKHKANAY